MSLEILIIQTLNILNFCFTSQDLRNLSYEDEGQITAKTKWGEKKKAWNDPYGRNFYWALKYLFYALYSPFPLPPPMKQKQLMNRIQLKGIKRVDLVEACRQSLAVSVAQEDTPFLPITSNQHNGTLWLISGSVNIFKEKKNDCIKAKCHSA